MVKCGKGLSCLGSRIKEWGSRPAGRPSSWSRLSDVNSSPALSTHLEASQDVAQFTGMKYRFVRWEPAIFQFIIASLHRSDTASVWQLIWTS